MHTLYTFRALHTMMICVYVCIAGIPWDADSCTQSQPYLFASANGTEQLLVTTSSRLLA